jgi:hypothetical protein
MEPVAGREDRVGQTRARPVELVDKEDAGPDVVARELFPDSLGLALDALDAVHDDDGAIYDACRALDLHRKVDVAGCVDDVDGVALPLDGD